MAYLKKHLLWNYDYASKQQPLPLFYFNLSEQLF